MDVPNEIDLRSPAVMRIGRCANDHYSEDGRATYCSHCGAKREIHEISYATGIRLLYREGRAVRESPIGNVEK